MDKTKTLSGLIHIIAWGIVLGIPFFFTGREMQIVTWESYIRFLIVPVSFMLVFYINYFYLVKKFLFTQQQISFLLSNLILIAVVMVSVHLLMQMLPHPPYFNERHPSRPHDLSDVIRFFSANALLYALVAGLSVAIRMTGSWYDAEASRKELERNRTQAELQNLKSQLNPHFLFNTLNNIYSLIAFSPEKAQEAVHDLSRLLRYVLYDSSQPTVLLSKEVNFLQDYIELMRIRLPEPVQVETDFRISSPSIQVPPLLFISLIENAFKHGVSPSRPSFVRIHLTQEDRQISCSITNSYFPKNEADKSGSGIGLQNLHKRLTLLHPNQFSLICKQEGDIFRSELNLTLPER
ncbi:sensor histidine kinase [Parabacteroides sp. Marseille-P3160]|uniref:sensor histidine kinase n=1 Tax=Parabacteroides sp. Marseille-P3160 TaxID=1917887 RepID=UPI0009BC50A9|nr:histidine kinase [Parabacteroides sp. Marseille-P3160]